jgi:anti-sigma regulatory factor (Ser/Thr protein kinase)
MKPDEIILEVSADPRLLSTVRAMVRSYLAEAGFTRERADEVVLGVDEACTNAIRHACKGHDDECFNIIFRSDEEWIEIQLVDSGEPAPAEAFERKERPEPGHISEIEPGGLGIHLIHEVFDEVEFCPGSVEGNCVTMRLRRPKPGRATER